MSKFCDTTDKRQKYLKLIILFFILTIFTPTYAASFSVHQMGQNKPVILIIGGIQGDEPGGFNAASLLTTHYNFPDSNIWVIPNLNFPSIIHKSRGIHGDMNRKFASLNSKDPEYVTVKKIQEIILDPAVALVINLHDGSGFYRPTYISEQYQPNRWGQCLIIDKAIMDSPSQFSKLEVFANSVLEKANQKVDNPNYHFTLNNTHTDKGNVEMSKTLSWFAVQNGKAAFGQEVSKSFDVSTRSYYHLIMLEAFFEHLNIPFQRNFDLTPMNIKIAINNELYLSFLNNKILLPLDNMRPVQAGLLPLPKNAENDFLASRPIIATSSKSNDITIHYGNNTITKIKAERLEYSPKIDAVIAIIDGQEKEIQFGDIIQVHESFLVQTSQDYRVNAIGADKGNSKPVNESGITLKRKDFQDKFSVDKNANMFRVEVYENKKIMGMFIVNFDKNTVDYQDAKQQIVKLSKQTSNILSPTLEIPEDTLSNQKYNENLGR